MKLKLIVAASLVAFSAMASAQSSVTATYGMQSLVPSDVQNHVVNFSAKTAVTKDVSVDAGILTTTADVANTITNRYELGVSGGFSINPVVTTDLRVATGMKAKSGSQDFGYYSVEPGVNAKFGDVTARVAYRYRDAFDTANPDRSNTMRYSVGYNVTKQDKVTLGWDNLTGDGANKTTTIAYTRSF